MYGSSRAKQVAFPRRVQSSNAPIGVFADSVEHSNFEIARIVYAAWLYTRASRFSTARLCDSHYGPGGGWTVEVRTTLTCRLPTPQSSTGMRFQS
jgi:hypothetical protein